MEGFEEMPGSVEREQPSSLEDMKIQAAELSRRIADVREGLGEETTMSNTDLQALEAELSNLERNIEERG